MMKELYAKLPGLTDGLRETSDYIHEHPELALHEFESADRLCALLESWGYRVTHPLIPELPTSFRAEQTLGTGAGEVFAFFAEYDALKGLGHGCGHNLIAASGLAAFRLAAETLTDLPVNGKAILFGTPAEEGYSGKVDLARAGAFHGVSASVISHPYDVTAMDDGALSANRFHVYFHGRASHAGMAPEQGINALDAMISLFQMIALWRQQLPDSARVHGIITNGGDAANIIPAETSAFLYLRAQTAEVNEHMREHFFRIVHAAAESAGCTFDIEPAGNPSLPCIANDPFNLAYKEAMEELGEPVKFHHGTEGRGSTDYGDVSQLMPGANLHFGICGREGVALHTEEMKQAAFTDYGYHQAMKCACAMASIGIRFLTDSAFRTAARDDFKQHKK